jgi:hypothetical protein
MSFNAYGMPCSGPRRRPALMSASAVARAIRRHQDEGVERRIQSRDPIERLLRQRDGR